MTTKIHRFAVNVPNPTPKKVGVLLRLERATGIDLNAYGAASSRALKVSHAGIARGPCADRGEERIKLTLDPRTSVDVYVVIESETGGKPGAATYNLVDNRGGVDVGGVMVACIDPPLVDAPGQPVKPRRPSPVVLANALYAVLPGEDPAKPASAADLAGLSEFDLVAPVTPASKQALTDVRIYLEHLGASDAGFAPGTWNAGTMQPGDVFYATWRLTLSSLNSGAFRASVVAAAAKFDPVRLDGVLKVMGKRGNRVGVRRGGG